MTLASTLRRVLARCVRPFPRRRRANMWASVYREMYDVTPAADGGEQA
jgi:hypothetical protein